MRQILSAGLLAFMVLDISGESLFVTIDTTHAERSISPFLVGFDEVYTFRPEEAFAD